MSNAAVVRGRLTRYRDAVLKALRASHDHPTAAEVYRRVRRQCPGVAFATIYNALNWLKLNRMIGEVNFGDQAARYDPLVERHDHLICLRCGTLTDYSIDLPPRLWVRAGRKVGFRAEIYHCQLFGLCARCAEARTREIAAN